MASDDQKLPDHEDSGWLNLQYIPIPDGYSSPLDCNSGGGKIAPPCLHHSTIQMFSILLPHDK